jgi:MFS family permease
MPLWLAGLLATTALQMAGSFMSQSLPVVAPLLTAGIGVGPERIGAIYALNSLGAIIFMACGTPLIARVGPLSAMRIGMLCGSGALLLLSVGVFPLVVLASLLLGLSYGPTPPSSTRILAATAPARHRGLIFSLKQAGAQLGGVLAGVSIAPVAERFGWEAGVAMPIVLGVLVATGVGAFHRRLAVARDPGPVAPFADLLRWRLLREPIAVVLRSAELLRLTILTTALAVVQGAMFSFCVTYLVTARGMSVTLAGLAYACMQAGGMFGRIVVGWAADRTGDSMRAMVWQGWASVALVAGWAALPADPGALVIYGVAGLLGLVSASWPGLMLAEVARLAPPGRVADAASGATMINFAGYVIGPAAFSAVVALTGSWTLPYLLVSAQMAVTILVLRMGR